MARSDASAGSPKRMAAGRAKGQTSVKKIKSANLLTGSPSKGKKQLKFEALNLEKSRMPVSKLLAQKSVKSLMEAGMESPKRASTGIHHHNLAKLQW